MSAGDLPHLPAIFAKLRAGWHFSPEEDGELFEALANHPERHAEALADLGFKLVRHERDFFYLETDERDASTSKMLPKVAAFAYILVDHAASEGKGVEEFILGETLLISQFPHLSQESYAILLRQVDVNDADDLGQVIGYLKNIGWAKLVGEDQVRFLRPFHRVLSKCLELSEQAHAAQEKNATEGSASGKSEAADGK